MKASTVRRWTIAMSTAALVAMPLVGYAQTTPPAQPPAAPQQEQPATPPPQSDATKDAVKAHLTAARNTLSQITQLPAAGQLQGDMRTQVSQLIHNFNELITTQSNWKAAYAKVESNLQALLNSSVAPAPAGEPPRAGTPGAQGTSGTTELDPSIRAKLMEFRGHLDKFEQAAAGPEPEPAAPAAPSAPPATPPATQPPTTEPPTTEPPAAQPPATQPPPTPETQDSLAASADQLLRHIEAIEAILGAQAAAQTAARSAAGGAVGTTGTPSGSTRTTITGPDVTLTSEQLQQLRVHLTELRRLVADIDK
jgi:hypothetical protein